MSVELEALLPLPLIVRALDAVLTRLGDATWIVFTECEPAAPAVALGADGAAEPRADPAEGHASAVL